MKIPGFKQSVIDHLTSKTSWAGIGIVLLAVYAFIEGRIDWQQMTTSMAMGFAFLGISDRIES